MTDVPTQVAGSSRETPAPTYSVSEKSIFDGVPKHPAVYGEDDEDQRNGPPQD